jgi:hypothetical protein
LQAAVVTALVIAVVNPSFSISAVIGKVSESDE